MADVFILGAGFSNAISNTMPLLGELSEKLLKGLPDTRKNELCSLFKFIPRDNCEKWLTYLSQNQPWLSEEENLRNYALFLEISRKITEVLVQSQEAFGKGWEEVRKFFLARGQYTPEPLPEGLEKCELYGKLIDRWQKNMDNIITLNYDTLVEKFAALRRNLKGRRFTYPVKLTPLYYREARPPMDNIIEENIFETADYLKDSAFPLYKLHGSVNWFYSGVSKFYGETIYCSYVSGDVYGTNRYNASTPSEVKPVLDKVPLIIPPVLEKIPHFQHETIRTLWILAGKALREASQVFCIGYSLPKTDTTMQFLIRTNAPEGKVPLYVVNRNTCGQTVERYHELLGDVYDVKDDFTGADTVERFIAWLTS
jgi:hypothetical protein